MRIPLTPHGTREVLLFGGIFLAGTVALAIWFPYAAPVTGILFLWVFWFFRDPCRAIPEEPGAFVSPADGKVTDVGVVEVNEFLEEPALRIGIFLSVFDVHVNRAPCDGKVEFLKYSPGKFHHANAPQSTDVNERQSVGLRTEVGPVLVRQIAGSVARRIVSPLTEGQALRRGDRMGMIKFGSRTELYVPESVALDVRVKVGDTVRGGSTVLAVRRGADDGGGGS
jgi:phosphatidylserine decarboxylase